MSLDQTTPVATPRLEPTTLAGLDDLLALHNTTVTPKSLDWTCFPGWSLSFLFLLWCVIFLLIFALAVLVIVKPREGRASIFLGMMYLNLVKSFDMLALPLLIIICQLEIDLRFLDILACLELIWMVLLAFALLPHHKQNRDSGLYFILSKSIITVLGLIMYPVIGGMPGFLFLLVAYFIASIIQVCYFWYYGTIWLRTNVRQRPYITGIIADNEFRNNIANAGNVRAFIPFQPFLGASFFVALPDGN